MNRFKLVVLAPLMAVLLPSCYDAGLMYPPGGYSGGNYGGFESNTTVYRPVGGFGNPGWGGGGFNNGWGGGGGGWNNGWVGNRSCCSRCGQNPCRCSGGFNHRDHRDHDDHDNHSRSSSNRSSSSDRQYRIIAGDLNGKKKPEDFHSLDWYHDRGYSLEKVKMETSRGAVIDKRPSSQKSSSKKSSSNNRSSSSSSRSSSGNSKSSSSKKK